MNTIAEVERCKNCPPYSDNRFDTLEGDFGIIRRCWRVHVRSVELTALVGRYAIHVIRPAPSAVPGLRLQRMDAWPLRVTHHLLRKNTSSTCPLTFPPPTIKRRTAVGKTSDIVLKVVWQPDVRVHLALLSRIKHILLSI